MSYLLEHFGLDLDPFTITPNTDLYCNLPYHAQAFETLLFALNEGNSISIVAGEVGTGKTMICRKLLNTISSDYCTAFVPYPKMSVKALLRAIASELHIVSSDDHDVYALLNQKLIENAQAGKKTVLVIDEAQTMSDEGLETIRLLTNLETKTQKLIQIVLFAQPELLQRLQQPSLRQFSQRVMHIAELQPLSMDLLDDYLAERLIKAGHNTGKLFNKKTKKLLWKKSKGIPRIVNILAYKAMLSAYARDEVHVSRDDVLRALQESKSQLLALGDVAHERQVGNRVSRLLILSLATILMVVVIFILIGEWIK